jgi:Glycosyl transferases group 1
MKFNICSNIDNGVGLEGDYKMLKGLLESWGHKVNGVHFKRIDAGIPRADVNIFLETLADALFPMAPRNWLIPNQEWWAPYDHTNSMHRVDKILCKTHDAVSIFKKLYPERQNTVQYIGFESLDLYDPTVPRKRTFLHIAGQSRYKNSPAVSYAFAKFFDDPSDKDNHADLTFVGAYPEEVQLARDHKNVKYIQRASDAEIKRLTNECIFAIIPSGAEGWGHVIHQSIGCGAVVITTDFPPMNEFDGIARDFLVPYQKASPELAAQRAFVGALEVKAAIERVRKISDAQIAEIHTYARAAFLKQREDFRAKFKAIVEAA